MPHAKYSQHAQLRRKLTACSAPARSVRPNAPARGFDGVIENFTASDLTVPLTRTCGWSDAPHIARTDYYRNFVIPKNRGDHNGGRRKFMEESLHYPMQRNFLPGGCWELKQKYQQGVRPLVWPADFDSYGTYLYGHASRTDGSYTVHRSLRGKMPQWGLQHDPKGDLARSSPANKGHGLTARQMRHETHRGRGRGRGRGALLRASATRSGPHKDGARALGVGLEGRRTMGRVPGRGRGKPGT
jgi:hypothetical protein